MTCSTSAGYTFTPECHISFSTHKMIATPVVEPAQVPHGKKSLDAPPGRGLIVMIPRHHQRPRTNSYLPWERRLPSSSPKPISTPGIRFQSCQATSNHGLPTWSPVSVAP